MFPVQRCPVKPGRWTLSVPRGTSPLRRLATGWTEEHGTLAARWPPHPALRGARSTCAAARTPTPASSGPPVTVPRGTSGPEDAKGALPRVPRGTSGRIGQSRPSSLVDRRLVGPPRDTAPGRAISRSPVALVVGNAGGAIEPQSTRRPQILEPPPTWSRRGGGGAVTATSKHSLTPPPPRPVIGGSESPVHPSAASWRPQRPAMVVDDAPWAGDNDHAWTLPPRRCSGRSGRRLRHRGLPCPRRSGLRHLTRPSGHACSHAPRPVS